MKKCIYCDKCYPETDFGVAKTTINKVFRRRKCRYCYRKTKNILKHKKRDWLTEHKEAFGCKNCGIKDPRVLDFHHTGDKDFTISDFYYHQYSTEKLKLEVEKCEVLCANCHRIHHHEERLKEKSTNF